MIKNAVPVVGYFHGNLICGRHLISLGECGWRMGDHISGDFSFQGSIYLKRLALVFKSASFS